MPLLTPIAYLGKAALDLFKGNKVATIAVAAVLVLGLMQWNSCNRTARLQKKLEVAQHNINALNDTIRYEKTKDGDTLALKLAFLTDKLSNLENLNKDLYDEVKTIKGKVSTIIKGDVKIVHDTVPLIVKGTLVNNVAFSTFDYSQTFSPGNSRKLSGYTRYNITTGLSTGELTSDELSMRFTTGIRNLDKGKPEIFLQSNYPGFTVSALDGAVLDPSLFKGKSRTKLITLGVGVGWTPLTYSFATKKSTFDLQQVGVTAGANINILKLLKPNR